MVHCALTNTVRASLPPRVCKWLFSTCLWIHARDPSTSPFEKTVWEGFLKQSCWAPNAEDNIASFIHQLNNSIYKGLSNCLLWVIPYEPCCLFSVVHRAQFLQNFQMAFADSSRRLSQTLHSHGPAHSALLRDPCSQRPSPASFPVFVVDIQSARYEISFLPPLKLKHLDGGLVHW